MAQPILSMHSWVSLSPEVRSKMRVLFEIPRSGCVEVSDGRIMTDGTSPKDFEALTADKMQTYLGEGLTDFHKLFDLTVARIQDEIEGKVFEAHAKVVAKRGRPKNAHK